MLPLCPALKKPCLLALLLSLSLPAMAGAVVLRDAELVAAGDPVLQNAAGTLRLEDARLGRVAAASYVPEPGRLGSLVLGAGLVTLLAGRAGREGPAR